MMVIKQYINHIRKVTDRLDRSEKSGNLIIGKTINVIDEHDDPSLLFQEVFTKLLPDGSQFVYFSGIRFKDFRQAFESLRQYFTGHGHRGIRGSDGTEQSCEKIRNNRKNVPDFQSRDSRAKSRQ